MKNILAFSGSLRRGSINTGLLRAAIAIGKANDLNITLVDIAHLPMYNQDLEVNFPPEVTELKNKIRAVDGILIATPEFNRSIPGALKNLFDWTSRPYGDNAWAGKTVAMMGAGGSVGTALAQADLKKILLYLDARVLGQPEFYVNANNKFNEQGDLTDEKTKEYLKRLLESLRKIITPPNLPLSQGEE